MQLFLQIMQVCRRVHRGHEEWSLPYRPLPEICFPNETKKDTYL